MIKSIVRVLALALIASSSPAATAFRDTPGEVITEYDRFKNHTSVQVRNLRMGGLTLTALYVMEGTTPSTPTSILFVLQTDGKDWQYLHCHEVDVLADGKPIKLAKVRHEGRVGSGYVLEFISFETSIPTLEYLTKATLIEGRLCNTEFRLRGTQIDTLRDFAGRMK